MARNAHNSDSDITLSNVRKQLRAVAIRITAEDGEYRVNPIDGTEATAYYTDDLVDALGTGLSMSCYTPVPELA